MSKELSITAMRFQKAKELLARAENIGLQLAKITRPDEAWLIARSEIVGDTIDVHLQEDTGNTEWPETCIKTITIEVLDMSPEQLSEFYNQVRLDNEAQEATWQAEVQRRKMAQFNRLKKELGL